MEKNEVVIQFSGGIDSLYLAYELGKKYNKVHLLTFYKGYLHFGMNFSKPNVENLKKLLGKDKVVYNLINMKSLFKEMGVKGFWKNSKRFGNETSWCIPCRASMAVMSILYALEKGIYDYTDGANWEQAPDGEKIIVTADNFPEYLQLIKNYSKKYKVNYFSPLYESNTREKRRNLLLKLGFKIDWNSMDVENPKSLKNLFKKDFYKRYQPMCISGYLLHWKRNLFKKKEEFNIDELVEFIKGKLENVGDKYIRDYFGENRLREILEKREEI